MALLLNGEYIKNVVIDQEYLSYQKHYQEQMPRDKYEQIEPSLYELAKENVIKRHLIETESQKKNITIENQEIDLEFNRMKEYYGGEEAFYRHFNTDESQDINIKKNIKRSLKVERYLEDIRKKASPVLEQEILDHYQKNKEKYHISDRVRIAHILIKKNKGRKMAEAIFEEVRLRHASGDVFYQLAKEYSECPSNKEGGDLGYVPKGKTEPQFEQIAFSLKKNEVSNIVETIFGWHLIKCLDHKKAGLLSYEESYSDLKLHLSRIKKEEQVKKHLEDLRKQANIKYIKDKE